MKEERAIPLPDADIIAAIGRVAITWSYVERAVQLCIWELAGLTPNIAEAVTTQLSLRNLIEILQTLVHERISDTKTGERLRAISLQITNDLTPKRNRFIHGQWLSAGEGVSSQEPELIVRKARGKVVETRTVTTAAEASKVAEDIEVCFWQLWDVYAVLLFNRVRGEVIP